MQTSLDNDALGKLDSGTRSLAHDVAELKDLAEAFERWHQDMIGMTASNRNLYRTGEDLITVARSLIMVSLNAAIEAARAGDSARSFVAVAAEVRSLANKTQELTSALREGLQKNSLLTTSTFQDIQAGGKLMMAAVSGLDSSVKQLRADLG